jgi:Cu(I)/Ag(I) efflux system protein CusF
MEAMTMPFKVKDAAMLEALKAGDKVTFSVAMVDDELVVTHIQVAK